MEITLLQARMRADFAEKPANTSLKNKISSAVSMIRDPGVLKPLIIINVFNVLQLMSGTYIIVFYAVDMVRDIGEESSYFIFLFRSSFLHFEVNLWSIISHHYMIKLSSDILQDPIVVFLFLQWHVWYPIFSARKFNQKRIKSSRFS